MMPACRSRWRTKGRSPSPRPGRCLASASPRCLASPACAVPLAAPAGDRRALSGVMRRSSIGSHYLLLMKRRDGLQLCGDSVPEAPRKLAGGEASPRAGTTGTRQQIGCVPEGTLGGRAMRSAAPSGAGLFLFEKSGGCARGLASPPANFRSASGAVSNPLLSSIQQPSYYFATVPPFPSSK